MPSYLYWLLTLLGLTSEVTEVTAQCECFVKREKCILFMTATAFVFDSVVFINDPQNQTICIGGTATMDCGYESSSQIVPSLGAVINGTVLVSNAPRFPPLLFKSIINKTNTSKVIIGPVEKEFVGITTFSCHIALNPPVNGMNATLTVVG